MLSGPLNAADTNPSTSRYDSALTYEDYPLLRWPLDHVFHSDHFKLARTETGPAWGSDHLPVFIELSLEPGAASDQEEPDSDRAETKRVSEKIQDGKRLPDG